MSNPGGAKLSGSVAVDEGRRGKVAPDDGPPCPKELPNEAVAKPAPKVPVCISWLPGKIARAGCIYFFLPQQVKGKKLN